MNKKVTIVNAHWSNRGDEAALRPIIDVLLSKEVCLTIIFKDRKDIQGFPYDNVKYFSAQFLPEDMDEILCCIRNGRSNTDLNLEKVVNTIKSSDLIVYSPGGAVISSNFWWVKQLEYLTPFICAKEFHIPIVVAAPSIGPFDQAASLNEVIRNYLLCSKNLIVRETISKNYLNKIGIEKAVVSIDMAFYDDVKVDECDRLFCSDKKLYVFFRCYKKIVAITMSDFTWSVPLKNDRDRLKENESVMREFVKRLTQQGYGVVFVPQLFGNQNDSEYLEGFHIPGTFMLSDVYDTYFQQYIIGKCYALVGMRYHSNIFAAKGGVPFIALGYEEKMYGFMEQWGLTDYLIRIKALNLADLLDKWDNLCRRHDDIQRILKSFRNVWREQSRITMNAIIECLEELK